MLHALLIDDDEDFLAGLAEIASQEGFAVTTAGSLKEARDHLSREPVDVAVVDLALPDGEGIELLQELKDMPGTDVIIISGVATVDSAIEALRLGALDYLTKPLDTAPPEGRARQRRARALAQGGGRIAPRRAAEVRPLRADDRKLAADAEGLRPDREGRPHGRHGASSPARAAPARSSSPRRSSS